MHALRPAADWFQRHPRLALALLLGLPLGWMVVVYLGSLGALLVQSFWSLDDYTGQVVRSFSLGSYAQLFSPANRDIVLRSAGMATAVTLAAAVLAFPLAYYMTFRASRRARLLLYLAVVIPLWSSYLVRVYAWKLILAKEGVLSWFVARMGLDGALQAVLGLPGIGGPSLSLSSIGIFLAFLYVWLPFMILPLQAALERVPRNLLDASSDLGAAPGQTFRRVVLPLALPGVVAGSIFTFSLTLGDFVVPSVLGNSSYFIGQAVLVHQGTSGNLPLAAAFTVVPMLIMGVYLIVARRMGAFNAL
ncbi:MAG TPA: ABC transporter permease [Pseudomonadota bacterium]|nr:ABC transporter permease [Pseudomonadota bacterium]